MKIVEFPRAWKGLMLVTSFCGSGSAMLEGMGSNLDTCFASPVVCADQPVCGFDPTPSNIALPVPLNILKSISPYRALFNTPNQMKWDN